MCKWCLSGWENDSEESFLYITSKCAALTLGRASGTPCGPVTDGLYTYNILDLTNPVLISTLEMTTPSGLGLNGNIVYVCRKTNGLSVVDVPNIAKPTIRKTLEDADDYEDIIVYDKLLICYVNTSIRLYDISIADNPVYISSVANE